MPDREAPVADNAQKAHTDTQVGLHDTAIRKPENNEEDTISNLGESPQKAGCNYLEEQLYDSLVHTFSKQTVNSNETRKRNFQHGNKEVFTAGSSSHSCENSVVDSMDARSKYLKTSYGSCLGDNCSTIGNTSVSFYQKDDHVCPKVKNTSSVVNSEELKENENVHSFNSSVNPSNLKNEKKKGNNIDGIKNNEGNTTTPQDFALPTGTDTSGLMTVSTDDNTVGKCMGFTVKQHQNEVIMAKSSAVDNANTTENESVIVDSIIENKNGLVQNGSLEEKGADNVTTLLDSCMSSKPFDANKLSSTNVSLMPHQGGRVDANLKTICLHSTTQEKVCQSSVGGGLTRPCDVAPANGMYENAYHHTFGYHPLAVGYRPHTLGYYPHAVGHHPHPHTLGYHTHPHPHTLGYHTRPHTLGYHPHAVGYNPHPHTLGHHPHPHTLSYHPHPHTLGYHPHPHALGYHPHIPLTVPMPYSLEEYQNLEYVKHMREPVPTYESQKNQLSVNNVGANFFQTGNSPSNIGENVHHRMDVYESGTMRNSEYEFRRSYSGHTSTEENKLQKKEITCCPSSLGHAYEDIITFSPRQSLTWFRKKKLLILDLNGLLADINEDYHNAHMADAKVRGKLVFRRPHCDDFLNFCIRNFELGVWSSRTRKNVDSVVDIVMSGVKPCLRFSWDRSKCTITGVKTLENKHKPLVLKELRKLWNKEEPDLPWEDGEFLPSNTLLVDDSPYKALRNPPYTAIFPYAYSYLNRNDNSLAPGGDLRVYLENLAVADHVECFVRSYPFGQPFITQSDPHWNFYAQVAGEGYASLACPA